MPLNMTADSKGVHNICSDTEQPTDIQTVTMHETTIDSPKFNRKKTTTNPSWVRKAKSPDCTSPPIMLDDKSQFDARQEQLPAEVYQPPL